MVRTKDTPRPQTGGKEPRKTLAYKGALLAKQAAIENKEEVKRKYRLHPGTKALREIKQLQRTTNLLVPKLPFQRLVREITQEMKEDVRFQSDAMAALQEGAEAYLTKLFDLTQIAAINSKRTMIQTNDMRLVRHLEKQFKQQF